MKFLKDAYSSHRNLVIIGLLFLVILAVIASSYFFSQYQKSQKLLQNPTEAAKLEVKSLVEKVGKLIELPQNEEPNIATVSDKNQLKDQAFFAKAENGDKVLIYSKAKKAIIYRPGTNKIIEVAPVNIGENAQNTTTANTTPSPTSEPKIVKIALYNGTDTDGQTNIAQVQINAEKIANIEIPTKEKASKTNYEKTLVVDLSGGNSALASQIAKIVGGSVVSSLPAGELKPQEEILVILGQDFLEANQ